MGLYKGAPPRAAKRSPYVGQPSGTALHHRVPAFKCTDMEKLCCKCRLVCLCMSLIGDAPYPSRHWANALSKIARSARQGFVAACPSQMFDVVADALAAGI